MALVLLTGAGLMIRTFMLIRAVDPGFRTENILTMTVDLPDASYPTAAAIHAFSANALAKISSQPGVIAAGAINWMPLQPALVRGDFKLDAGRKLPPGFMVAKPAVTPDYFQVMGIRLLQGRGFTERDNGTAPGVVTRTETETDDAQCSGDGLGSILAAFIVCNRIRHGTRTRAEDVSRRGSSANRADSRKRAFSFSGP